MTRRASARWMHVYLRGRIYYNNNYYYTCSCGRSSYGKNKSVYKGSNRSDNVYSPVASILFCRSIGNLSDGTRCWCPSDWMVVFTVSSAPARRGTDKSWLHARANRNGFGRDFSAASPSSVCSTYIHTRRRKPPGPYTCITIIVYSNATLGDLCKRFYTRVRGGDGGWHPHPLHTLRTFYANKSLLNVPRSGARGLNSAIKRVRGKTNQSSV